MAKREQDYKWCGILYPDSETYKYECVIEEIKKYFKVWYYSVHDGDLCDDGTPKKTHIHWVGIKRTEDGKASPVERQAVAGALGVEENYIESCRSEKGAVKYLVHDGELDKCQYKVEDIKTNNPNYMRFFKNRAAEMKAEKIAQYILDTRPTRVDAIIPWVMANRLYAEFRRGFAIWHSMIREYKEELEAKRK